MSLILTPNLQWQSSLYHEHGCLSVDARDDALRGRSLSAVRDKHHRAESATRGPSTGSVAPRQVKQVAKSKRTLERHIFRHAKHGEADRNYETKKPKHLNSGKRSLGTSTIGR